MSKEEDQLIEKLILDGGLEAVAVDQESGELLYSFTPKIQKLMPNLYNEHLNEVNANVMNLWEKGFINIDFFAQDPLITLTEKAIDPKSINELSKHERWNLFEVIRLLKR
jgi:uncharacterized protein YjgD (DUF1641 family)